MPVALGSTNQFSQHLDAGLVARGAAASVPTPTTAGSRGSAFAQRLSLEGVNQVEAQRTPLSTEAAGQAIARAYSDLTGNVLSDRSRSILTAQWAHETGHGASMFNYNFGGIKGVGPSGMTVAQRTREGFGANERRIVDNFRAYANADEGAKDYVQLLMSRYTTAVSAAERGDASGFVRGLKEKGYFTGDPAAYERSIAGIANRISGSSAGFELASSPGAEGISRGPALQASTQPNANDPNRFALSGAMPEWQRALTPAALLEVAGVYGPSGSSTDKIDDLTAVNALQMSDEVTRAALRIAASPDDDDRKAAGSFGLRLR